MTESESLEAQARKLVDTWTTDDWEWISDGEMAASIAAWARRLVADAVSECARNHVNVVEKLLREKVAAVVQSRAGKEGK